MTRKTSTFSQVKFSLGDRSYHAKIGQGVSANLGRWLKQVLPQSRFRKAFLIYDRTLRSAKNSVASSLRSAGWVTHSVPVVAGENLKSVASIYSLYEELLKRQADRDSVLLALGGGTVGDAMGFVAATYMRGIPWVSLPTTLLSQVDSGVGGKTGINHARGKNLIGAICQPCLVVCDVGFLKSLTKREIVSGLGEVIKYGIVFDPDFFSFLQKNWSYILKKDPKVLSRVIKQSLFWKSRVVSQDERDESGIRETLNFGHTFGHALETATDYSRYQHGEAVILGMRFAVALSEAKGLLNPKRGQAIDSFLSSLPVPPLPSKLQFKKLFSVMKTDKKVRGGRVRFVLLSRLGKTVSVDNIKTKDLLKAYSAMTSRQKDGTGG